MANNYEKKNYPQPEHKVKEYKKKIKFGELWTTQENGY